MTMTAREALEKAAERAQYIRMYAWGVVTGAFFMMGLDAAIKVLLR